MPTLLRSGFRVRLRRSVDMTSDVKSGEQIFLGLHRFAYLRASEEPEPVMTTVDRAALRGLVPTFLAAVGCLPHSRDEQT